jgi:hypothetical protein
MRHDPPIVRGGVNGKTQIVETQAKGANIGLWVGLAVAGFVGLLVLVATVVTVVVATGG